ncbi:manganese transport protein [Celerinatantimonas diazotrophica]|uniref:Divalent metal cation transporter MntH n=2 Tax=Celerinatantimonas diazotrophica TaxID=412034 RepID=A0A4R1KJZ7_9GAMM|nr:Nramp family divalent metal transporter [Celerinatantimonas diazotrophica]TCK63959.1 manganese transport protein [Celerinatantimonas diazotrophica]CAG9297044.1 Divalent metal cation transporter MntH [Celerinatantimonas diazotrophica]
MLQSISDSAMQHQAQQTLSGKGGRTGWMVLFGPALIAAVAYVDPGNFATNIEAGSRYGYALLWVVLMSNVMAMLIQAMSARLGLATGKNLAEVIRERFPKPVVWFYWVQAEIVAIATDLAEFLGAALAFNLLFGLSMMQGAILTGIITYAALQLQRFGFRLMEIIIGAMIMAIAGGFFVELFLSHPDQGAMVKGLLLPSFPDSYAVYLATGILGATIMPHVIYLHSALSQNRISTEPSQRNKVMRYYRLDVIIGMTLAGLVNMALLALAAATFHRHGYEEIVSIGESYKMLAPLMGGNMASYIFGFALLLAGLSSSIVGTMSGQILMQGFVRFHIPIGLRRLITMVPAIVVIVLGVSEQKALVASQVILSFGIPFALIPLVKFTADKKLMGNLVNRPLLSVVGVAVCTLIIILNAYVLFYSLFE